MKKKVVFPGTVRIGRDLKIYKKTGNSWKEQNPDDFNGLENTFLVINLFKKNRNFNKLIDKKNPKFLKGQRSPEGKCQGARINILPDGRELDGAYSLFARHLTIHDQKSHFHWDVIYQNPNGAFAYHYTLEKKKKAKNKKFNQVKEFEKIYPTLEKNVFNALENKKDYMALPIYTLLKTYIRVGNEIYFRLHNHKGLTTLKKQDVKIDGISVNFSFIGKNGVPQSISRNFPERYIKKLKERLNKIKKQDFIFKTPRGRVLHEEDFKKAFKKYCGKSFYPHIVRSFFATKQTEDFLRKNKNPNKKQTREFLFYVAEELGHKKYSKKNEQWEESYSVTIGYYIAPRLVEKLRKNLK